MTTWTAILVCSAEKGPAGYRVKLLIVVVLKSDFQEASATVNIIYILIHFLIQPCNINIDSQLVRHAHQTQTAKIRLTLYVRRETVHQE